MEEKMKKFKQVLSVFLVLAVAVLCIGWATGKMHGVSMRGEPKYKEDFKHLEYVNPEAPKGGELRLAAIGTFDSLNPYILKGDSASGLGLTFETLKNRKSFSGILDFDKENIPNPPSSFGE
jgi:microcin C transport system substrate-binding protein